jgi:hypothetical protein
LAFKVESEAWRAGYRLTRARPGSAPYISGDSFRALFRHRVEPGDESFNPAAVVEGEIVYCEAGLLPDFLSGAGLQIGCPYSVLSHNGDLNIDRKIASMLPRNVARLFAQNVLVSDPRVVPIPIGLENRRFHANGITRDYDTLRRQRRSMQRVSRILYGFTSANNPKERGPCLDALRRSSCSDFRERTNSREYRRQLARYRFVASPPGNGEDCHRTWEAMYLRVVPIVKRSVMTEAFRAQGLPLLVVDNWGDITKLDDDALEGHYRALEQGFDHPALWMGFWTSFLREVGKA